jgi:hypothetical protein
VRGVEVAENVLGHNVVISLDASLIEVPPTNTDAYYKYAFVLDCVLFYWLMFISRTKDAGEDYIQSDEVIGFSLAFQPPPETELVFFGRSSGKFA